MNVKVVDNELIISIPLDDNFKSSKKITEFLKSKEQNSNLNISIKDLNKILYIKSGIKESKKDDVDVQFLNLLERLDSQNIDISLEEIIEEVDKVREEIYNEVNIWY